MSLLFAAGERPSAADIGKLLAEEGAAGERARISHRPEGEEGRIELLASGLTFDIVGLAPAPSAPLPPLDNQFGLSFDPDHFDFEAISLLPGRHVSGGSGLMPVVRTMIGLAAVITLPLEVKAICWHPAQSCMERGYFTRMVMNWLSGGAFPALGLTAVRSTEDGAMVSVGLDFLAGQEVRFENAAGQPRTDAVRRVVRVINHIITHGPITGFREIPEGEGNSLLAEASKDGRHVRVWRSLA